MKRLLFYMLLSVNGVLAYTQTLTGSKLEISSTDSHLARFYYDDNAGAGSRPRLDIWGTPNLINLRTTHGNSAANLSLGTHNTPNALFVSNSGNIGIGTILPVGKLNIYNSNIYNSNMTANGQDHILLKSDDPGNGGFYGGITWESGGRRRASIVATREHDDTDYVGIAFFTKGTDGPGPIYESMRITRNGNVGIGTSNTFGYRLAVNGTIGAKEVKVEISSAWPDYVFSKNYSLRDLNEIENFVIENEHLPDMPTASEVEVNGINLGEMDSKLLMKIEELTLYMIEMNKEVNSLKQENDELKRKVEKLESAQ